MLTQFLVCDVQYTLIQNQHLEGLPHTDAVPGLHPAARSLSGCSHMSAITAHTPRADVFRRVVALVVGITRHLRWRPSRQRLNYSPVKDE